MKRIILNALFIFFVSLTYIQAQSNLQITFNAGSTILAAEDTVYMYSAGSIGNPGNHWQYGVGELVQPGTGIGRMTSIGQDVWTICFEPFSYFSQGSAGVIPNGSTMYNIDMLFHDPSGSFLLLNNNNNFPFNISLVATSTTVITAPVSNSPGQITSTYQSCTLGINSIQVSNGVLTNFPNPLIESTQFIYTLHTGGNVSLKVFNAIGQVVKTVVNEKQNPNTYSYIWKGDNDSGRMLYNGMYYYTLSINGKAIQTNKLVISK